MEIGFGLDFSIVDWLLAKYSRSEVCWKSHKLFFAVPYSTYNENTVYYHRSM